MKQKNVKSRKRIHIMFLPNTLVFHKQFGQGSVLAAMPLTVVVRFTHGIEECAPEELCAVSSVDTLLNSSEWHVPLERLLTEICYVRESKGTVYLWPNYIASQSLPPLVLRLIKIGDGNKTIYLVWKRRNRKELRNITIESGKGDTRVFKDVSRVP